MSSGNTNTKKPSTSVKIVFLIILLAMMAAFLEGGARFIYAYKSKIQIDTSPTRQELEQLAAKLKDYEQIDPAKHNNWHLKPSYKASLEELIAKKERSGHTVGAERLRQEAKKLGLSPDFLILQINSDGFRGPEIDPAHSRYRILTIGDSCTFGMTHITYPREIEKVLSSMGKAVEVINGGVEGYAPLNALYHIEEYKKLKPEAVTIYIGGASLYGESPHHRKNELLYSIPLIKAVYERVKAKIIGQRQTALKEYQKQKNPDRNAYEVRKLENYTPSFMSDVEKLVLELKSIGSEVFIITTPNLFVMNEDPSEEALAKGHLPHFTDNPFVLAKLNERYNVALRKLAEKHNVHVIDIEQWAIQNLQPLHEYFSDSVHFYSDGYRMLGKYIAQEIAPYIKEKK